MNSRRLIVASEAQGWAHRTNRTGTLEGVTSGQADIAVIRSPRRREKQARKIWDFILNPHAASTIFGRSRGWADGQKAGQHTLSPFRVDGFAGGFAIYVPLSFNWGLPRWMLK
jgi:hypothetical protein